MATGEGKQIRGGDASYPEEKVAQAEQTWKKQGMEMALIFRGKRDIELEEKNNYDGKVASLRKEFVDVHGVSRTN